MTEKNVTVTVLENDSMCAIPVTFDPKAVFGKVRAPVKVTINGHTFRSTIARMSGRTFIPLRKSNREAAGVAGGDRVSVRIASDDEPRVVDVPADLAKALKARSGIWKLWGKLSYTSQRECVESVLGAKKQETRDRRIARVIDHVAGTDRSAG